jgi:lipoprotein NlpI
MAYLREKLEEMKDRKRTKKERKAKWENWVKTQAMFYKKTSTNYKKWENFESDSTDSDEKEPILPEHDPGFKAMEADMNERKKKRQRDTKEANICKERGNKRLKMGLYKTAEKDYTDGLELRKDMLPLYSNRALARNKLEKWQGAIDDCTRILEYCEVFDDGFSKNPDLCFKALIRRAVAFRGQRDYKIAQIDIEESLKLYADQPEAIKLKQLNEEDIELEERISKIMEQRDGLSDKEFIDFTIEYLIGQKDEEIKIEEGKTETLYCKHPIKTEDAVKLSELLKKSSDLLWYFIKNKGLLVLKDSFEFNTEGINILDAILESDEKAKEEFQKVKGYEALIDYLYGRSKTPETKSLEASIVKQVFQILEDATLNEFVRTQLAEKKRIKDLFIAVLKTLDLDENISLFGTLISFGSNL